MRENFRAAAPIVTGLVIFGLGVACIVSNLNGSGSTAWILMACGILLLLLGTSLVCGRNLLSQLKIGSEGIDVVFEPVPAVEPKTLDPEQRAAREAYAEQNPPPAVNAPAFNALTDAPDLAAVPAGDPMVPMYILDANYRILDWNDAFSLAFDRTMEGRRGQSAIEWIYFLDNFKEVLDHGIQVFSNPDNLPRCDVEELKYSSLRYGKLSATKRAYQIPDANGSGSSWLILLDLKFAEPQNERQFHFDLIRTLSRSLMWSDYALSYDQVLTHTRLYQDLIKLMTGVSGPLAPIPQRSRVLDLGAGTGNIARLLASDGRTVFAIENNRTMLNVLRKKCHDAPLRRDDGGPGVIALKQDINSLFGLPNNYFDCVIANNVLYSLADPLPCLQEVRRVVKAGGEIRISGPRRGFRIPHLFDRIERDLVQRGEFDELKQHFENARRINLFLEPELRRWSERDHVALFEEADLSMESPTIPFYQGNGEIIVARRPA